MDSTSLSPVEIVAELAKRIDPSVSLPLPKECTGGSHQAIIRGARITAHRDRTVRVDWPEFYYKTSTFGKKSPIDFSRVSQHIRSRLEKYESAKAEEQARQGRVGEAENTVARLLGTRRDEFGGVIYGPVFLEGDEDGKVIVEIRSGHETDPETAASIAKAIAKLYLEHGITENSD